MKLFSLKSFGVFIGFLTIILSSFVIFVVFFQEMQVHEMLYLHFDIVIPPILSVIIIPTGIILIIASIFMIRGIIQDRHKLILPWLMSTMIIFILVWTPIAFIAVFGISLAILVSGNMSWVLLGVIPIGLFFIVWTCIYVVYSNIRQSNSQKIALESILISQLNLS